MIDLQVNLAGIQLKNPLVLASGIMGISASSLSYVAENGAAAVTMKSIGPTERIGHNNPTVYSWGEGLHNAVGLPNPGIDEALPKMKEMKKRLRIPLFASMFADTEENFQKVVEKMMDIEPTLIEIDLSCPNTHHDFGRMYALDPKMTANVIKVVKKVSGRVNIFAKLTAESPDIVEIAKAAESVGADGITTSNTLSGMIIDIYAKKPILRNKVGGISGPAIKPIALRSVYNLYKAVKIPIIGLGGVNTGEDVIEYIMAGATAVGVGSGVYYRGVDVFKKIIAEMKAFMKKEGYKNLEEIRGIAHE